MNWDKVQLHHEPIAAVLKMKWTRLTDDDFALLNGNGDLFIQKVQNAYGLATSNIEREIERVAVRFAKDPLITPPPKSPRESHP